MAATAGTRVRGTGIRALAWSNVLAQGAEQVALAAAPLLLVTGMARGVGEVGALHALQTLPYVLFAIPAGILADRLSKRRLMIAAEALRCGTLGLVLGLLAAGQLSVAMLALLAFAGTCGTVVHGVCIPAMVPGLVASDRLAAANARIELGRTGAFMAGPAVGGALVGYTGAHAAFGLAVVLSGIATLALFAVPEQPPATRPRRDRRSDLVEGFAFVARHALLRPVFVVQFVFNAGFFVLLAMFVPYAAEHLSMSPQRIGLVLGVYGAGLLVGVLCAPAVMRRLPLGQVIAIGPVCGLLGALAMAATFAVRSESLAAVSFFLLGAGPMLWVIGTTTLRQTATPAALLGRVSAINILAYGARPLGAALAAVVGQSLGYGACLALAVGLFGVQAVVILRSPVLRVGR